MIADLVVLVADKNMEHALKGILSRPQATGIHPIDFRIFDHPERDSGCYNQGPSFLHSIRETYRFALLILDRDGSGREPRAREDIENEIEEQFQYLNLSERTRAVVIEPELENWLWSPSPHVASALGWRSSQTVRSWLEAEHLWLPSDVKPANPKGAVEAVMRHVHKPRSSAVYLSIAQKVSYLNCHDPAFGKLLTVLRTWFPPENR